jgi:acetolactate synthase-1/3 small subunit
METKKYTITIFTENFIGLLSRITLIFTRRHINIESITVSESEVKGVHRYTMVVRVTEEQVQRVVKQIEKQVEAIKAFYYLDEDTIHQEIALYKVSTKFLDGKHDLEKIIRTHQAHILSVESAYMVIEKTGHKEETQELLELLQPYGVLEFVRSGWVSISKPMRELSEYLEEIEENLKAQRVGI